MARSSGCAGGSATRPDDERRLRARRRERIRADPYESTDLCGPCEDQGGFDNRWFASAGRLIRATVSFRFVSQTLGRFMVLPKREDLVVLREFIEAGKVTPVIGRTYPLSESSQAIDHVGEGHARGKVVI